MRAGAAAASQRRMSSSSVQIEFHELETFQLREAFDV